MHPYDGCIELQDAVQSHRLTLVCLAVLTEVNDC